MGRPLEDAAYRLLEQLRWGAAPPVCPHCRSQARSYYLQPADNGGRRTRSGAVSARRVWKCGSCRRQFSVLTATILSGTKVDLRVWVAVFDRLAGDGRIPTPAEVMCRYGSSRETARRIVALLEAASEVEPVRSTLAGLRAQADASAGTPQRLVPSHG